LPGKPGKPGNTGGGLVVVSGSVNEASVTGAPGPGERNCKKKMMTFKGAQSPYFVPFWSRKGNYGNLKIIVY